MGLLSGLTCSNKSYSLKITFDDIQIYNTTQMGTFNQCQRWTRVPGDDSNDMKCLIILIINKIRAYAGCLKKFAKSLGKQYIVVSLFSSLFPGV